jgi:hypothetical protein
VAAGVRCICRRDVDSVLPDYASPVTIRTLTMI